MEIETKEKALEILDDALSEVFGDESDRDEAEWSSNEYLQIQLGKLFDILKGRDVEESLDSMQRRRNKLNRQISTLKKAKPIDEDLEKSYQKVKMRNSLEEEYQKIKMRDSLN